MARVIGLDVMAALAIAAFVPATTAAQAPAASFRLPSGQFGPRVQTVPPAAPPQQPRVPPLQQFLVVRPQPARLAPPPVRCTMRVIPVDPTIDPTMIKEPDRSVNYAKKEVPPPACR